MSEQLEYSKTGETAFNPLYIGLTYRSRQKLYNRIDTRVDKMLQDGLLDEARRFYSQYDGKTSSQAIGYKELLPYIEGKQELSECVDRLKMQTRRYAKRQLTWFNRNKEINWFFCDDYENYDELLNAAVKLAEKFISKE